MWRPQIPLSDDDYHYLFQVFQGNMERNLVVVHKFRPSLKTRYVRIHPRTWYSYISMRVELYGCRLGEFCSVLLKVMCRGEISQADVS